MRLALARFCDHEAKIRKFIHKWTYVGRKTPRPEPPVGSIIECDCGEYFKMNLQGLWEQGEWSAEFTSMSESSSS